MLKGQAKTTYQREYMRKRRGLTVRPNAGVRPNVQPSTAEKLKAAGIVLDGNRIISPSSELVQPGLPVCDRSNWRDFQPGDRVMMRQGRRLVETVVPERDAEGNPIPD